MSDERDSPRVRVYPSHCTSAFCGRLQCDGCPLLPKLEDFKAWVKATDAVVDDPIWCPSVWTARKPDTRGRS